MQFQDTRPKVIAQCAGPGDVAEAIAYARDAGLPATARSGGHCFAGRSSTDGVLIDVGPMHAIEVEDGIAVIGAGARLGNVYDALAADGLTMAAGCGPDVGIAGLTLGGGLGILGRRHGLTADQLVAAEVVLADGRVVECDEQHDPDLFWALRGAGGCQFGVVTRLSFRAIPVGEATCLKLVWPAADAAAVIEAWQSISPAAPDELAASLLVNSSTDPERPPTVTVFGAMLADERTTAAAVDELVTRAGTDPRSSELVQLPYRAAKRHLAEHGPGAEQLDGQEQEGVSFGKSEFFRVPLPADAIGALVENFFADRVPGEARELDFSPWGGAYNRVPPDATAFPHREELFLLKQAVAFEHGASDAAQQAGRDWLRRSWGLVHPWGSGGVYPNFPDPDLDATEWPRAYHRDNYERLVTVKAKYDPDGFFRFDQAMSPR